MNRLALIILLFWTYPALATEYFVSSGVQCNAITYTAGTHCISLVSNGQPVGDDTKGNGSQNNPWATPQKAFDAIGTNGAGHIVTLYPGAYDSINGWRTDSNADTRIPTGGNSFAVAQAFTVRVLGGGASGARALIYRRLASGATNTIAQVQQGVHFPTAEQCAYMAKNFPPGYAPYPSGCVAGATGTGTLWEFQDDTNSTTGSIIDVSGANDHHIQYVIFDGLIFDGRGINKNIITNSGDSKGCVYIKHIRWKNGEMRNSAASIINEPGVDNSGCGGQTDDWDFSGDAPQWFEFHHCGIPFDNTTKIDPADTIPARLSTAAKYLHCAYPHVGGFTGNRVKFYQAAGQGAVGFTNLTNGYVFDNAYIGAQGMTHVVNSVFRNNGAFACQNCLNIENSTLIADKAGKTIANGGTSRDGSACMQIIEWQGGGTIQNNICDGFTYSIDNYECHPWNGNTGTDPTKCYVTTPNTIRNNRFNSTTQDIKNNGNNNGVDIIFPITSNNTSGDPGFDVGAKEDYWPLSATSQSINKGYANGLATDYAGNARDATPDAGAYERVANSGGGGGSGTSSWTSFPCDPANCSSGWGFSTAVVRQGKMVVFLGPSQHNSIRQFDPATQTWSILFADENQNNAPIQGMQARDNYCAVYNEALDELWIWGGSHQEIWPKPVFWSGRFSFAKNQFIARGGTTCTGSGSSQTCNPDSTSYSPWTGLVDNPNFRYQTNNACAWSAEANAGMMFGGSRQGNPTNDFMLIEPAAAGKYTAKQIGDPLSVNPGPPPRDQAQNLLVAGPGGCFYLFAGHYKDAQGVDRSTNDFWQYCIGIYKWTKLPDPPTLVGQPNAPPGYQAVLTYDKDQKAIVANTLGKIYAFSLISRKWQDLTPTGLPCGFNQSGAYTTGAHYYQGGNDCVKDPPANLQVKVTTGPITPEGQWFARKYEFPYAPGDGTALGQYNVSRLLRWAEYPGDGVLENGGVGPNTFDDDLKRQIVSYYYLHKYSILNNTWQKLTQPCNSGNPTYPLGRNEFGWVWDSKRKVYWFLPGYQLASTHDECPTPLGLSGQIMTFDPVTKAWATPKVDAIPTGNLEKPKNGIYDPTTDRIYRVGISGNGNVAWFYLDLSGTNAGHWTVLETACAANLPTDGISYASNCGTGHAYINDVNLGFEQIGADLSAAGRKLYVIDPFYNRLFQFDMNTGTVTIKARPPQGPIGTKYPCHGPLFTIPQGPMANQQVPSCHDYTWLWFSVNGVLLYPYVQSRDISRPHLLVYDPGKDVWTQDPMNQPDGREVRGNTFFYDAVNNTLLSYGGMCSGWSATLCDGDYTPHPPGSPIGNEGDGGGDPSLQYFFLISNPGGSQGTPQPPLKQSLTLQSANPNSGVPMNVQPIPGDTTTTYNGSYDAGSVVTVTAPATTSGNTFSSWTGCTPIASRSANPACTVTMDSAKIVVANYQSPTPPTAQPITGKWIGIDQDKTGETKDAPDGKPDFHVTVTNPNAEPSRIRIVNDTVAIWEWPYNNVNWVIHREGTELWFSVFTSKSFDITYFFPNGSQSTAHVDISITPPTPPDVVIKLQAGVTYRVDQDTAK